MNQAQSIGQLGVSIMPSNWEAITEEQRRERLILTAAQLGLLLSRMDARVLRISHKEQKERK